MPKKHTTKTCTCDHPVSDHNEAGCCAKVGMLDDGQSDLCRCLFRVERDLDFGYSPVNSEGSRIEAGYDTQAGY